MKVAIASISLAVLTARNIVDAWKECSLDEGGGVCPSGDTCCSTETPGISSCIPTRKEDPEGARGQCCDPEGLTGCPYGYDCGTNEIRVNFNSTVSPKEGERQKKVCKLRDSHPTDLIAKEISRYQLCRLPSSSLSSEKLKLQRFPVGAFNAVYYSSMGSILPVDKHDVTEMLKFSAIETVLVIVHGSGRNADEYLCAGISTAMEISDSEKVLVIAPKFTADVDHDDLNHYRNTLYWLEHGPILSHTWRYGANAANSQTTSRVNTTRSGKRKMGNVRGCPGDHNSTGSPCGNNQNGISSYTVMDKLLEFLIASKQQNINEGSVRQSLQNESFLFPKLKRIVVAGHSAGGQYVHRWALLSSSPIVWGEDLDRVHYDGYLFGISAPKRRRIEIRTVVANPRSYCYLDNRRMIRTGDINTEVGVYNGMKTNDLIKQHSFEYAVPDPREIDICPTYNQWQWGLQPGGDILCPYKDNALAIVHNNLTALALRYLKRKVFYLVGEHDTIKQEDHCETYNFQGDTRNQRSRRYFWALIEFLKTIDRNVELSGVNSSKSSDCEDFIHEFHQVQGSPHDHTLMFQSIPCREAFYGMENKEFKCHDDFSSQAGSNSKRTEPFDTKLQRSLDSMGMP